MELDDDDSFSQEDFIANNDNASKLVSEQNTQQNYENVLFNELNDPHNTRLQNKNDSYNLEEDALKYKTGMMKLNNGSGVNTRLENSNF